MSKVQCSVLSDKEVKEINSSLCGMASQKVFADLSRKSINLISN